MNYTDAEMIAVIREFPVSTQFMLAARSNQDIWRWRYFVWGRGR